MLQLKNTFFKKPYFIRFFIFKYLRTCKGNAVLVFYHLFVCELLKLFHYTIHSSSC